MNNQKDQTILAFQLITKVLNESVLKGGYDLTQCANLYQAILIVQNKITPVEKKNDDIAL